MSLLADFIPKGWGSTCTDTPLVRYWTRDSCLQLNKLVFIKIFKLLYGNPINVFFTAIFFAIIFSLLMLGVTRGFGLKSEKIIDQDGEKHEFEALQLSTKDQIIIFFSFFGAFLIMGLAFGAIIYVNGFRIPSDVRASPRIRVSPSSEPLEELFPI